MNENIKSYFESRIADCEARSQALTADQRFDEANMEKIRGNVYDIFRTVLDVAVKKEANETAAKAFFMARAEQIPAAWQESLAKAREHDDAVKERIELIKLEAIGEIKAKMAELWEVEA